MNPDSNWQGYIIETRWPHNIESQTVLGNRDRSCPGFRLWEESGISEGFDG